MKQLTKEQIIDIFNRYCYIDCCGRVCHAYRHPEHNTMMPVPEHDGYFLANYEESQLLVYGNPCITKLGDVEHYPEFDFGKCDYVAEFGFGNLNWDERGYYYYSIQDHENLVKNPENNNNFYSCLDKIPERWGY